MKFEAALVEMPIVAILRGVTSSTVLAVADALVSAGIKIVEVPLNSPEPLESISRLSREFSGRVVCGAGTVLDCNSVDRVHEAGGTLVVAPNVDHRVINRCVEKGITVIPGFVTPTEAFVALEAGARYLKLFPAGSFGPAYLRALGSVLPKDTAILPVGGVGAADISAWLAAGASGFGIGTELFTPGTTALEVHRRAATLVSALQRARSD
jgi:2-dehydro-3-deoxyphosphogalactonate aldolase